jgi:hypothetical protein
MGQKPKPASKPLTEGVNKNSQTKPPPTRDKTNIAPPPPAKPKSK